MCTGKWSLKKTRRQASKGVCGEQWPREKVRGQEGEGFLCVNRIHGLSLPRSEEAPRWTISKGMTIPRTLVKPNSRKMETSRTSRYGGSYWPCPPSCSTCTLDSISTAPSPILMWPLSAPGLCTPEYRAVSWLPLYPRHWTVQDAYWGLSSHSGIKPSSSSRFSKHLLVELISAATESQRKSARGWVRSNCREIPIINRPGIQNLLNGFVKAGETFPSEAASLHSECLWLMKWPLITIIACTHTHTLDWNNCLEISGWTWAEELMKGSDDSGCHVYVPGLSWLHPLPHQVSSAHLPSHRTLPYSNHVQATSSPVGYILQLPKINFLIARTKASSWRRSYKNIDLPLLPVPACTRVLQAKK